MLRYYYRGIFFDFTVHPQTFPNTIPDLLGCLWCWFPGVIHTRLHSKRAVERYTASPPPTTPLQSSTAYTALYSVIQRCIKIVYYTAIQPIQYTALYNHLHDGVSNEQADGITIYHIQDPCDSLLVKRTCNCPLSALKQSEPTQWCTEPRYRLGTEARGACFYPEPRCRAMARYQAGTEARCTTV